MEKQKLSFLKSKAKASTLHLLISCSIAFLVGIVVFFVWYPSPFGFASGGLKLFLLITAVDLVLGPALTFVVFNPKKRRALLYLDFSVIAAFQLGALVYGVNTVYVARPVAVVNEGPRMRVVSAVDIDPHELEKAPKSLRQLSNSGPVLIGTREVTPAETADVVMIALQGKDIGMRPEFWIEFDSMRDRVIQKIKPMNLLVDRYPDSKGKLEQIARERGLSLEEMGFLPVLSKQGIFTAMFTKKDGAFVDYIMLDGSL